MFSKGDLLSITYPTVQRTLSFYVMKVLIYNALQTYSQFIRSLIGGRGLLFYPIFGKALG